LVMEFAHGGALHRVVRRRPVVQCCTLADWALQVAEGMQYLHEKVGLVHRDLKTANILIREPLVQPPGPDDLTGKTLIISDFGMSCPADALGSRVSGVGTVAYAAPEVICMRVFSLASDVWSYGVVLWEIFTMLEPFKEFDPGQQLAKIGRYRQKLLIPRSDIGFPETIGSLLARCWADEPEERPTFCDIRNCLIEAQNDEFFSLSIEEFTARQETWIQEISGDAELSLLTESCSSEASSPLRRQNEFLQQENAKMRDALQALQQNEARYRGTIAGLQKDNQILSVLVANTLLKNTLAPPAPRKKPFMYNLFRRNEEKKNSTSLILGPTNEVGDNESSLTVGCSNVIDAAINSAAATSDRPPRDYSPVVKSNAKRHGKNSRKSILGISYPQEVRHVIHVPLNLFGDSNNDLYP
uniref:Protein kinase domain-containing protein n=3 Tax=Hymenolepis diminuta TaxID=6216 RepID=A0A0R3SJ80_HYMDI